MEKMSHRSVSESKGKYSMLPGGQTFTDRMDHITLLLVGMLLELLLTLAQVRRGSKFWCRIGFDSVHYHALKIDRKFTFSPESFFESGSEVHIRKI